MNSILTFPPHAARTVSSFRLPLLAIAFFSMFWLLPHVFSGDMNAMNPMARLTPPGNAFLLGSDGLGRDVLSRCLHGGQISLSIGLAVALLTASIGACIGLLLTTSAWLDALVMRVTDGMMAIPAILLAIAVGALSPPSAWSVIIAITVAEIPPVIRLVRSVVIVARRHTYVEAALVLGTGHWSTLIKHILPNLTGPLIVQATAVAASAILVEAAMSFLGIGLPPDVPTWGAMIADSRNFLGVAAHLLIVPGAFLMSAILMINFLGDWLRTRLDPKLRESK